MHERLDPAKIIATVEKLKVRIVERFPQANLASVAESMLRLARAAARRSAAIARPNLLLRLAVLLLLLGLAGLAFWTLRNVEFRVDIKEAGAAIQVTGALFQQVIYVGVAVVFLFSLEARMKRKRALDAIHELRAIAHIVDMHQLTKDPDGATLAAGTTASSPPRGLPPGLLMRYLDYCSEMLALLGKISALYVQNFQDPAALSAADDLESLTTGLSRKIWQKIAMISAPGGGTAD